MKKTSIILLHAFVLWGLCGTIVGIGLSLTTIALTLIIHAIGALILASIISYIYYKNCNYTTLIQTASIFVLFIIVMDTGLVAPIFEKSYDMFKSVLGTWVPFTLIFAST